MAKKLYENVGEAINEIANVDDVKEILGLMLRGDVVAMPYIVERTQVNPARMNRKVSFGSADTFFTAGSYRIGASFTETPNDGNLGWMEVSVYKEGDGTVNALQVYTADDGTVSRRVYDGSAWTAWS